MKVEWLMAQRSKAMGLPNDTPDQSAWVQSTPMTLESVKRVTEKRLPGI